MATASEGPLNLLAARLAALRDEHAAWQKSRSSLQLVKHTDSNAVSTPLKMRIAFTQKTWVFSYLTPVVGYASFPVDDDSFAVYYVATQLHFWPNPVNDVLWSRGFEDLKRSFALEVGVATKVSTFGPDSRFSGPRGLPPLFGGVAFHLIPYTSVSGGVALVEERRSTLSEERAKLRWLGYIGLTVQFNIPDLVRQARDGGTTTSVEK
jgi:hypothetical protein